jgi:hypothetical protein
MGARRMSRVDVFRMIKRRIKWKSPTAQDQDVL